MPLNKESKLKLKHEHNDKVLFIITVSYLNKTALLAGPE